MILAQIDAFSAARDREIGSPPDLEKLANELAKVNESILECEHELRECEAIDDFGTVFVNLAGRVNCDNNRRTALKLAIDALVVTP
jgi:hypothetical protein